MFYCKKRFGQNFLVDPFIISSIIKYIEPNSKSLLLEIGPGFGAITGPLLNKIDKLIAIEIDRDLVLRLHENFTEAITDNKLVLINQDVLTIDFIELLKNYDSYNNIKIIGNLPYNISTELLFKLFDLKLEMHFLLQKEVAQRLIAVPNSKDRKKYGKLSVMAQYYANISIDLYVKSNAFKPEPKVESALVKFMPVQSNKYDKIINYEHFDQLVTTAFSHRRKTIHNILRILGYKDNLECFNQLNINLKARPEELWVSDFIKLSNACIYQ